MINELAQQVHQNAKDKGFFDAPKNIGEMLCLIHSEVSEALEADRKDKHCDMETFDTDIHRTIDRNKYFDAYFQKSIKDTFEDELADIIIRVMDLAAFKNIDLENHMKLKRYMIFLKIQ